VLTGLHDTLLCGQIVLQAMIRPLGERSTHVSSLRAAGRKCHFNLAKEAERVSAMMTSTLVFRYDDVHSGGIETLQRVHIANEPI
jgi:hypothetical protein